MHKHKSFLIIYYFISICTYAQIETNYNSNNKNVPMWAKLMYSQNPDQGEVIKLYEEFYKTNKFIKNKHTQYYKRWIRNISRSSDEKIQVNNSEKSNQWQCVGPWDFDKDAASRSYAPGAAHIYTVEQAINNNNVLYAGSATAGAWKTMNKGLNWELITKELDIGTVYSIEIDFLDYNTVYISGNGGIYKSTDGGLNWNLIGDQNFNSTSHAIVDIKLNPDNNQILFVASNNGLYKSIDGGNNFTEIISGEFLEIEFHPHSSDTMYFVKKDSDKTIFYRSDDGGTILTQYNNGWPDPLPGDHQRRTEIAVSPDDPNKIVALATGSANGGSGLYGIYISYDKGENWTFRCCGSQPAGPPSTTNINMMGWQPDGSDDGGQYYYDLALAVNPYDANIIHVGGVNHWISFDDGFTFTCPAKWSQPHKKGYVHADIHDINYFGNDLWFACDGGIFYSDNAGDSIYKKQYGIAGSDFWGFGSGFKDKNVMLGGTYHNGTLLKDNNTYINDWLCTDGGDGIRGFVNFGNPRMAYSDYGGKILSGNRTVNISTFNMSLKPNASYIIGESSQMEFDPRCYNWHYIGNDTTLWLSKNNGSSFEPIFHFNNKVTSVEVAWSNPDVIYVATWESWWGQKQIWKTNDAGKNWTEITPTNINGQIWIPYDITISSDNENILWIARTSMYGTTSNAQGYEVFKSINGGQSWINLTTPTLDDINITNIEHQRGSDGGVYIGTRKSVYYRNNTMNDWEIYNHNLPARTFSTQLVPYYREGLLINATNRSVYEIDLFENSPPSAQIAADKLEVNCMNDTVKFIDHSAVRLSSASWQWNFPGGTPSSSSLENPIVTYHNPGSYDVTLTVTDAFGSSTQTINSFIVYKDTTSKITNNIKYVQDFESGVFLPEAWTHPPSSFNWQSIVVDTGSNCYPTTVAYVNHYSEQYPGKEAYLITNKIKLGTGNSAQNILTYDFAYAGYASNYNDGFRIDISRDCGHSWDSIYGAIGPDLQTTGYANYSWYPTCGSWDSDTLNLSSLGYNGDTIMIRFTAINDYGNNFFLDNIKINGDNINGLNSQIQNLSFILYPNPNNGEFILDTDQSNSIFQIIDIYGRVIKEMKINNKKTRVSIKNLKSGFYIARMRIKNKIKEQKLIINK